MELGFDPLIILRMKPLQKAGVALLLCFLVVAGYGYFFLQERIETIKKMKVTIQQQEQDMASKRRMLARLPQMREELAKLKEEEARLARKLPSKEEIPTLLTDISNAAHEQGLELALFAPGAEISRDLYAEVPVGMEVRGSFHAIALFVDQVARMSRIVTFADMTVEANKEQKDLLVTKARATTYRFLDQQALAKEQASKGKGKK